MHSHPYSLMDALPYDMLNDSVLNITFSAAKSEIHLPKLLIFIISPGQLFVGGVFFSCLEFFLLSQSSAMFLISFCYQQKIIAF